MSDRAGAAVASAMLKAFEIITDRYKSHVVDKSKLRKKRQKCIKAIRLKEKSCLI